MAPSHCLDYLCVCDATLPYTLGCFSLLCVRHKRSANNLIAKMGDLWRNVVARYYVNMISLQASKWRIFPKWPTNLCRSSAAIYWCDLRISNLAEEKSKLLTGLRLCAVKRTEMRGFWTGVRSCLLWIQVADSRDKATMVYVELCQSV